LRQFDAKTAYWHHDWVITTATPPAGLGFNPLNVVKSAGRGLVRVASNPNVQRAAAAGAQAYAPDQYASAQMYADRARGIFRPPPGSMPMGPPPPPPMMAPDPDAGPGDIGPGGVKSSSGLVIAGVVAVGLLVLLMSK